MKRIVLQIVAIVLSVAAAVISLQLVVKHVQGDTGIGWFDAGCASEEAGGADCEAVIKSKYGSFPFVDEADAEGVVRIPVALLGFFYYSSIAVWLIGVGSPTPQRRHLHFLPLALIVVGLAGSIFFTIVMFSGLENWCPWCIVTHVLNLLIAVCMVLLWPGRPATASAGDEAAKETGAEADSWFAPHARPNFRQVAVSAVAICFVAICAMLWYDRQAVSLRVRQYEQALTAIQSDPARFLRVWKSEPVRTFTTRPDDAIRVTGAERKRLGMVIFSDFECPSCRRFARFLDEKIQPLFDGNIDLMFKHYPLNRDCNTHTKTKMHGNACVLLRLAEAARIVGGSDAFWKVHDYLFENQRRRDKLTPDAIVAEFGFDPAEYARALQSEEIMERVAEDTALAASFGVRSTPTVFIYGRRVDGAYRGMPAFWDRIAEAYWHGLEKDRPEHTKLENLPSEAEDSPSDEVTPDNRDPTAAP